MPKRLTSQHKKGDTLVEVMFAVGVFGAVAIGAISLMNKGLATAQSTLEATMARQEVDAQIETLRFLHGAYIAESNDVPTDYSDIWKKITASNKIYTHNSIQQEIPDFFTKSTEGDRSCTELYEVRPSRAFVINTHNLALSGTKLTGDVVVRDDKLQLASTYPRLLYGYDEEAALSDAAVTEAGLVQQPVTERLYAAEGIWVTAVRSDASVVDDSGNVQPEFFDFYVQTCWDQAGSGVATAVSSIIRLYNPGSLVYDDSSLPFSFKLHYDPNDSSEAPAGNIPNDFVVPEDTVGHYETTVSSQTPTREGYKFSGWVVVDGDGHIYHPGDNITLEKKVTELQAIWDQQYKFVLLFDSNGGSDPSPKDRCTEDGYRNRWCQQSGNWRDDNYYNFTITSKIPSRSHYKFVGWATSESGEVEYQPGDTIRVEAVNGRQFTDFTLHAKWQKLYSFTLSYNANQGSNPPSGQTQTDIEANSWTTTVTTGSPTRNNYRLLNWNTKNDGSGTTYNPGDSITLEIPSGSQSTELELFAIWKRTYHYELTFKGNNSDCTVSGLPRDMSATVDDTSYFFDLADTNEPTCSYRTFKGWGVTADTSPTSSNLYKKDSASADKRKYRVVTASPPVHELYAIWQLNSYTVDVNPVINGTQYNTGQDGFTFDVYINGTKTQTGVKDYCESVAYGSTVRVVANSKSGYALTNGDQTLTVGSSGLEFKPTWTVQNRYILVYDANGGSLNGIEKTNFSPYTSDTYYDFTVPSTNPTRPNYTFLGWGASSSTYSNLIAAGGTKRVTTKDPATTTLYAIWNDTMQSWNNCSSLKEHGTVTLKDTRDNNTYKVVKLGDGKCWMQQDLNFVPSGTSYGGQVTASLKKANTNISSDKTYIYWLSSCDSNNNKMYYENCIHKDTGSTNAVYNFGAASAGTINNTGFSEATNSICPKGWHLPTATEVVDALIDEAYRNGNNYLKLSTSNGHFFFHTAHWVVGAHYWTSTGYTVEPVTYSASDMSTNNHYGGTFFGWCPTASIDSTNCRQGYYVQSMYDEFARNNSHLGNYRGLLIRCIKT